MAVNCFVNKILNLGIVVTSRSKSLYTLLTILICAVPYSIDNLLEMLKLSIEIFSLVACLCGTISDLFKSFGYQISRKSARIKHSTKGTVLIDHVIDSNSVFPSEILNFRFKIVYRNTCIFKLCSKLRVVSAKSFFQQIISSVRKAFNYRAKLVVPKTRPKCSRLFEIAYDKLPRFSPTRTDCFPHGADKLRSSFNFGCSLCSIVCQICNRLRLILTIALSNKIRFRICSRNLLKRLSKNLSSKPIAPRQ